MIRLGGINATQTEDEITQVGTLLGWNIAVTHGQQIGACLYSGIDRISCRGYDTISMRFTQWATLVNLFIFIFFILLFVPFSVFPFVLKGKPKYNL